MVSAILSQRLANGCHSMNDATQAQLGSVMTVEKIHRCYHRYLLFSAHSRREIPPLTKLLTSFMVLFPCDTLPHSISETAQRVLCQLPFCSLSKEAFCQNPICLCLIRRRRYVNLSASAVEKFQQSRMFGGECLVDAARLRVDPALERPRTRKEGDATSALTSRAAFRRPGSKRTMASKQSPLFYTCAISTGPNTLVFHTSALLPTRSNYASPHPTHYLPPYHATQFPHPCSNSALEPHRSRSARS